MSKTIYVNSTPFQSFCLPLILKNSKKLLEIVAIKQFRNNYKYIYKHKVLKGYLYGKCGYLYYVCLYFEYEECLEDCISNACWPLDYSWYGSHENICTYRAKQFSKTFPFVLFLKQRAKGF